MAAIRRTSVWISLLLPRRSNSCSCNTRSSFGCSSSGISPTSSRNSELLSASSKRPMRWALAPVNAPRSWPKRSLSSRPAGIAAQFIFTIRRLLRPLRLWMARAISSLPVPVSPRISTVLSLGATISTCLRTLNIASLRPMISPNSPSTLLSCSVSARFSSTRRSFRRWISW